MEQTLRNLQGLHLDDQKGNSFIGQSPAKSNVAKGITFVVIYFFCRTVNQNFCYSGLLRKIVLRD